MTHLSDDQLVLHYYGEDAADVVSTERHLRACAQCAAAYEALGRMLDAVTPAEVVEAVDDVPELRQVIRDRMRERSSPAVTVLVWLVPLLYPFAIQALFGSAQWARANVLAVPLAAFALISACAGPLASIVGLNRISVDRGTHLSTRVLVVGAVMATIAPALFVAVSLANDSLSLHLGMSLWYGVIACGGLLTLIPWPAKSLSTTRVLHVHQLSAAVLTIFVLAHVVNQALAFISLSSYAAMRSVMRIASQQPISYALLVGTASIQIVSGAAMGLKRVRAGASARNLQAVSGWCLAAFLLVHVFSSLLFRRPSAATTEVVVLTHFNLLATSRLAPQLPFLLLGVAAFLFHVGVYARLAALAYLADASARRLSYAGAVVGATIVVIIGLSLCGVHLLAQTAAAAPTWEVLIRTPLPATIEPVLSVNGLTMPAQPVPEHSHPGQVVVAYIVDGRIENQVDPEPPATLTAGGFFSEAPGQLHKAMRNLDAQPAKLLIFHAGKTGVPASLLKTLPPEPMKLSWGDAAQWQVPIPSMVNQQLRLMRLTLPTQTRAESATHTGPGMIYVLEGTLTIFGAGPTALTYHAGELVLDPPNREGLIFRNMSDTEPTKVLLFHVSDPRSPVQTPPMLPYVAVHEPVFVRASNAPFAMDDDLVIGIAQGQTAKAYMALDLAQHGSVDDRMPDGPIEVTWCSACGTGAVFRSEFNGRLLHFDYDSMVNANEVHKDVETGSRWQQSTGEAISGPLKGSRLTLYPFVLSSWKEWRTRYPNTMLLKPLPGYLERIPILRPRQRQALTSAEGEAPAGSFSTDTRLRPRQMIAGLAVGSETMAFDVSALRITRVVNERVGGVPVLVIHQPSSSTTTAFEASVHGTPLRFQAGNAEATRLVDLETHSTWNAYGLCLDGRMKGTQLKPLILVPEFWFAWSQFRPGTRVFTAATNTQ